MAAKSQERRRKGQLREAVMVSGDKLFALLLIGILYLMIHMADADHWTKRHHWRH